MSEAVNEEWEEVTALDGNVYRVLKNPPVPTEPLPVSDSEMVAIDAAIEKLAKVAPRRGVSTDSPRTLNEDKSLCGKIDELIVEALVSIRGKVKDDSAEKLFERLSRVCDGWSNETEGRALGLVFIRFMDTMEYLVSYRGKFRGKTRATKYSKDEAHRGLKERGLTRK